MNRHERRRSKPIKLSGESLRMFRLILRRTIDHQAPGATKAFDDDAAIAAATRLVERGLLRFCSDDEGGEWLEFGDGQGNWVKDLADFGQAR